MSSCTNKTVGISTCPGLPTKDETSETTVRKIILSVFFRSGFLITERVVTFFISFVVYEGNLNRPNFNKLQIIIFIKF